MYRKKDELIQRILNAYSRDELQVALPEKHYALTELGALELKQNEYVPYLHRHQYMSVWEMNIKLHTENPSNLKYRDILWREFNIQSGEYFQNLEFGLYRNTRLAMHDFLVEENKYKTALHLLLEVIAFDLSGLGNGSKPISTYRNAFMRESAYESRLANLFTTEDKMEVVLPIGIIRDIENLYECLEMAPDEFICYVYQQLAKIHIHERIFNETECANIVLSELGLEERKLKNSYLVAQQRLKAAFNLE